MTRRKTRDKKSEPKPEKNPGKKSDKKFEFVDVCCGIGAFHVALKRLGGQCVLACDKNEESRSVYEANHGPTRWHSDIYALERLPRHDVFCAGFPCTTFSLAGLRRGTLDKDAGGIIFKIIDLLEDSVKAKRSPSVIILENVPGLVSIHGGKTLKYIEKALTGMGYNVSYRIHDASDYGAPMHRQRLIISATRNYVMPPECEPRRPLKTLQIRDIKVADSRVPESYYLNPDRYVVIPESKWYEHDKKVFVGYVTAVKYKGDELEKISAHSQALKVYHEDGSSDNFTSTNRYAFLISGRVRYLLPVEMYACMGFPKRFKLYPESNSVQVRQVTNSINLHMLRPVCEWIMGPFLRGARPHTPARAAALDLPVPV